MAIVKQLLAHPRIAINDWTNIDGLAPIGIALREKNLAIMRAIASLPSFDPKLAFVKEILARNDQAPAIFEAVVQARDEQAATYRNTHDLAGWAAVTGLGVPVDYATGEHNEDCLLILAAKKDNVPIVRALLRAGANPNFGGTFPTDNDVQETALTNAIFDVVNMDIVKLLLSDSRTDLNLTGENCETPLLIALDYAEVDAPTGEPYVLDLLLADRRTDPNFVASGDFPLRSSVRYNNLRATKRLLAHPKINPNLRTSGSDDPALFYCLSGRSNSPSSTNLAILRALLLHPETNPNIISCRGNTPLHTTIVNGDKGGAKLLLSHRKIDPNIKNSQGKTPLHLAIEAGAVATVKQLLAHTSTNPNLFLAEKSAEGSTYKTYPMQLAIRQNNLAIVKELLMHRAIDLDFEEFDDVYDHITTEGSSGAVHPQKGTVRRKMAKLFLSSDKVNPNNSSFLMGAIMEGDVEMIALFLKHPKANPNLKHEDDPEFLVCQAIGWRQYDILKALISHPKTDLGIKSSDGEDILTYTSSIKEERFRQSGGRSKSDYIQLLKSHRSSNW